jgi:predicted nucleic acid-binding protein
LNRFLLDTNVVSELRKPRPHGAVLSWISELQADQIYLSAVTIGELQTGVQLTRRQNPEKADEIELWVDQLAESSQVLPMDASCFREWARLMNGKTEHLLEDAMIAATARIHNLTVATRNEKDFKPLGVRVLNPFKTSR